MEFIIVVILAVILAWGPSFLFLPVLGVLILFGSHSPRHQNSEESKKPLLGSKNR
jgi:hypothetical protein